MDISCWLSPKDGRANENPTPDSRPMPDFSSRFRYRMAPQQPLLPRPPISRSQGARWNALINRYIGTMPPSGEACMAEQSMSGAPVPDSAVSSAIAAKVGAAASESQSAIMAGSSLGWNGPG